MKKRACKSCGAMIGFMQTPQGKWIPYDVGEPVTIVMSDGVVARGWTPHWVTCPAADKHRKR